MKKLLVAVAMLLSVAGAAAGQRVYEDLYGNTGTLKETACSHPGIRQALAQVQMFDAVLVIDGKTYQACYATDGIVVIIVDEEGDMFGPIPLELFKESV